MKDLRSSKQPKGSIGSSKFNISEQNVIKIKAEIHQNREEIDLLQQRNDQLHRQLGEPRQTNRTRSRQSRSKLDRTPKRWLSITLIAICLAIVCGIIGFAVTKLMTVK